MDVVAYEFPEVKFDRFDSNWLLLNFRIKTPQGEWSATQPCMLTWELSDLATWFEDIAKRLPSATKFDFMEPELSLEWTANKSTLRLYLDYGLRPQWKPYIGRDREEVFFLECMVTSASLLKTAKSLKLLAQKFPLRECG